jgi:hypothetical protein
VLHKLPGGYSIEISPSPVVSQASNSLSVFSGVFQFPAGMLEISGSGVYIAAKVDGVGEKVSGDTTTVHVQTLLEAFVEAFQT